MELKISIDTSAIEPLLSTLVEAAKRFPKAGDSLLCLIESGEELFSLDSDRSVAPITDELVVRLNPSDGLLRLLSAARAGNRDFLIIEHSPSSVAVSADKITT